MFVQICIKITGLGMMISNPIIKEEWSMYQGMIAENIYCGSPNQ